MGIFGFFKSDKYKNNPVRGVGAVIVAAGNGTRMGASETSKVLMDICYLPVISYTLKAYQAAESIKDIVVVAKESDIMIIGDIAKEFGITKLKRIVVGGDSRSKSVRNGLAELDGDIGYVAIADGARPFITPEKINETVEAAKKYGGAAVAVPVRDTLKKCSNGKILSTVSREGLYAVQTPQVFDIIKYRAALSINSGTEHTDDCGYFESAGFEVALVEGDSDNIKITYKEDLAVAKGIVEKRRNNV